MNKFRRIVVVGASLAGLRAVEAARRIGFTGEISLVGEEPFLPYDRPPLSKEVLVGTKAVDEMTFRSARQFEELDVALHLGRRATRLDVERSLVSIGSDKMPFDGLVIATGAQARKFPNGPPLDGVYVIRNRDDAETVARALQSGPRLVVVGAGFVGGEVASSARQLGLSVTMLEAGRFPLHALGPVVGARYAELHQDNGVQLKTHVRVVGFEGVHRVEGVRLVTGELIPADVVVVGVGAAPSTGWLQHSGLQINDGVVCDRMLCAGPPNIFAAGDIARWYNPRYGRHLRLEHWANASEQGSRAMRHLLGAVEPRGYDGIPYFWSDQHGIRIQFAGDITHASDVLHYGPIGTNGPNVTIYRRGDRLVGVTTFGSPSMFARLRAQLSKGATWEEAVGAVRR